MIKAIKHGINLIKNKLRGIGLKKRSSAWSKLEKEFLLKHPICAACGSKKHLNVHHCKPFHIFPELELDPDNLITMCMDIKECHLKIAHGDNFKAYCPNVRKYVEQLNRKEKTFEEIYEIAKKDRLG